MRIIPKNTKVKVTFYKSITITDIIIALIALALLAITLSSNFSFRGYIAIGILCVTIPLYITIGDDRLYKEICYFFKYLFQIKRYKKNKNLENIIPYREIKDSFVYNKDSSVFGVIKIEPINFDMKSSEAQDYIIDGSISRILNSINIGEELFLTKVDEPLILDDRLNEELKRLDKLNDLKKLDILNKNEFESRMNVVESRMNLVDQLNTNEVIHPGFYLSILGISSKEISEKLDRIIRLLETDGIKSHKLNKQELNYFISLGFHQNVDLRIKTDRFNTFNKITFYPLKTKIDNSYVTHLVINKYPITVPNGWLERLYNLDNTKLVLRTKPLEKSKAIRRIDSAILELESKNVSKESEMIESENHQDSLKELLEDLSGSNETLFDTSIILTIYDDTKEYKNKRAVKEALLEMGFGYSEMCGRQLEGFISSLISTKELTRVRQGIQTSSLAAGFPFNSDQIIERNGMYLGENNLPTFIDFFKRDNTHVNSNMVIIGQSGSGKSYATKTLLTNLASDGCKVYVLDPENEYGTLAKNLGGVSIDASNGFKQRINPFEILTIYDEDGNSNNSYYSHLQFLEQFYKVVLPGISSDALEMLNKLTEEVYRSKNINAGTRLNSLVSEDYPIFEDLYNLVLKRLETAQNEYEITCLRILFNYLSRFANGGRDSSLWNGYTTFSPKENFIAFNFQKLIANRNDVTSNAEMLLLLKWLENEVIKNRDLNILNHSDNKIVIAIDEAHLFIDEKYPIALDFMYSLAKRIRKYNGMLIIITQNIKDFAGTEETSRKSMAIINVSQYSMIFNLSPNDMTELLNLYQNSGGFNDIEKDLIIHSQRGECFLISAPNERERLYIDTTKEVEDMFG